MVFLLELIYMWKDMVCNIKSDQRQPSREQSLSINLEKPLSLTSRGMVGEHLNIAQVFTKKTLQIQTIHRMEINRNINFYLNSLKTLTVLKIHSLTKLVLTEPFCFMFCYIHPENLLIFNHSVGDKF